MSIYLQKAYAKVNIFLKITGYKDGYHTIASRFMRVNNLYDTISFVPQKCKSFTIEGCKDIPKESNSIYKAYKALNEATGDLDILDFFYNHKVVVEKNIPSQAGLGGGSSDAGTFLRMVYSVCNLKISIDTLAKIGSKVGADVPFFVYGYSSANVTGFGEIIEEFDEESLPIEVYTPDIGCDTAKVYGVFHKEFLPYINPNSANTLLYKNSKEILSMQNSIEELNDLYKPAKLLCPSLNPPGNNWYFSGSGSSFFCIKE